MKTNSQFALDLKLRDDATRSNYTGVAIEKLDLDEPWLYLWGLPGSGRTHLLQACCHDEPNSIYLDHLLKLDTEVLQGLEAMSLVCIDNIEQVLGDRNWEEALFHLMNAIKDSKGKLILAANAPASKTRVVLPDLKSRLLAATAVETDQLSDEDKLKVLMQRAHNRGFQLSEDVGRFILSRSGRDMRQLLDLLQRLELETLRQHKRVTIPFVKQTLSL